MADLLGTHDAAVPWIDGFYHPLAAVYRATVIPNIEALLAADRLRPRTCLIRYRRGASRLKNCAQRRSATGELTQFEHAGRLSGGAGRGKIRCPGQDAAFPSYENG